MITYHNYHPVAYPDEKLVPVPGWGMHPILAGNPVIAIGDSRYLPDQPYLHEGMRRPHAPMNLVLHRTMPQTTDAILAERPYIAFGGLSALGMSVPIKTPLGTQTIDIPVEAMARTAVDAAWPDLQKRIEAEATKILNQAQPRLRTEIDRGLKDAKRTGYILGAAIVVSVFAAAWWIKKGQ